MVWALLAASLVVILAGAELFTNGIEWVGEGFGLSEGAVGSVLAAVGTALPETLLPIVAILSGHSAGDEIGIGAILGAPFMLTTLAMFALGVTVVVMSRRGKRSSTLEHDPGVFVQDLSYFLVMYSLALVAGLVHVKAFNVMPRDRADDRVRVLRPPTLSRRPAKTPRRPKRPVRSSASTSAVSSAATAHRSRSRSARPSSVSW